MHTCLVHKAEILINLGTVEQEWDRNVIKDISEKRKGSYFY